MNHFRFRLDGIDVFRIEMTDNTSMATTDRFHFEDPRRHHYISSDTSSLSGEKMAELDSIIEDILSSRSATDCRRCRCDPRGRPRTRDDVFPTYISFETRSETARVATYITKHTGYTTRYLFKRVDYQTTL